MAADLPPAAECLRMSTEHLQYSLDSSRHAASLSSSRVPDRAWRLVVSAFAPNDVCGAKVIDADGKQVAKKEIGNRGRGCNHIPAPARRAATPTTRLLHRWWKNDRRYSKADGFAHPPF